MTYCVTLAQSIVYITILKFSDNKDFTQKFNF